MATKSKINKELEITLLDQTSEDWMNELLHYDEPDKPKLGVVIECRVVLDADEFSTVSEILDFARGYGTATVTRFIQFEK